MFIYRYCRGWMTAIILMIQAVSVIHCNECDPETDDFRCSNNQLEVCKDAPEYARWDSLLNCDEYNSVCESVSLPDDAELVVDRNIRDFGMSHACVVPDFSCDTKNTTHCGKDNRYIITCTEDAPPKPALMEAKSDSAPMDFCIEDGDGNAAFLLPDGACEPYETRCLSETILGYCVGSWRSLECAYPETVCQTTINETGYETGKCVVKPEEAD